MNAYPLLRGAIPREARGVLAALVLLTMAVGGALHGAAFDLAGGYRPLFLFMAGYAALAIGAIFVVPRGAGEAR